MSARPKRRTLARADSVRRATSRPHVIVRVAPRLAGPLLFRRPYAARPGRNYGFPFCWSEGLWTGPAARGTGAQHLDPDEPGGFSEARCQDPAQVVPPVAALRAHLAPLDLVEYAGAGYPAAFTGDLFVTSHGSWNRESGQVGRLIIRLHPTATGLVAAETFLGQAGAGGALIEGGWALRPVSIRIDPAGLLTFSDDNSGTIHKIGYRPAP